MKVNFAKFAAKLLPLVFLATIPRAYGHGMSQAGPNGGEIRMPGIFHTEVYLDESKVIRTFLLDGEIENPVIQKSSVTAYVKREGGNLGLECKTESNYFACQIEGNNELKAGDKVVIQANRQGQVGVAVYAFPFKYSGKRDLASQ